MSINIYYDAEEIKQIVIVGELAVKEEIMKLLELIKGKQEKVHITFFDANMLPKDIIKELYDFQKKNCCKIYVLKSYLYSYLYKLGIYCHYIARKFIDSPETIGRKLEEIKPLIEEEIAIFLKEVHLQYGYDFTKYQIQSIIRRVKICMIKENIKDFRRFKEMVLTNEDLFEELFITFSINTTEFFRDPEVFQTIREEILPYLNRFAYIKIWCAGCSTGQEPYSLAIILDELAMLDKAQIYATDINPYVIEEAKNGLYPIHVFEKAMENYKKTRGNKTFADYVKLRQDYMEIDERLKKSILFFHHSLVGSGMLNEFQLILCRNVLIYMQNDLQKKVLKILYYSLDRGGVLVLGKSEGILCNEGSDFFYKIKKDSKIFKCKER
ncbi:chemotaxis protein methyltransferase CheR [Clostridium aceticum]|uniref:Chemotaxis protein methyltransferase CheR n=1 Tax=Clostridium aceticum TaxID=84022 RepID=A0A0G3WDN9_9CLOT|nr:protein-glutamate O-methyltransferase CheR [Clostridium aceticum]AKL96811.1 chemotaxis protein methyltransferase CheR [Clostridium aceticum]